LCVHKRDEALLLQIQKLLGVGGWVIKQGLQYVQFSVVSIKDILILINHLEKFPLISAKKADYLL
jgi:hypothetical protein